MPTSRSFSVQCVILHQLQPIVVDSDLTVTFFSIQFKSVLQKQCEYFKLCLFQDWRDGKVTDEKLNTICAELAALSASVGTIKSGVDMFKATARNNSTTLNKHNQAFQDMESKLANMEDRSRRCNIRITGLEAGFKGSNATQFLSHTLPKWFPTLCDVQIEIMRVHRIYNGCNQGASQERTSLHQRLEDLLLPRLQQLHRRQSFHQAIDAAQAKGVDFYFIRPSWRWKTLPNTKHLPHPGIYLRFFWRQSQVHVQNLP